MCDSICKSLTLKCMPSGDSCLGHAHTYVDQCLHAQRIASNLAHQMASELDSLVTSCSDRIHNSHTLAAPPKYQPLQQTPDIYRDSMAKTISVNALLNSRPHIDDRRCRSARSAQCVLLRLYFLPGISYYYLVKVSSPVVSASFFVFFFVFLLGYFDPENVFLDNENNIFLG